VLRASDRGRARPGDCEILRIGASTKWRTVLEAVEQREWRTDPVAFRVFQDFLRGGFEGGLPPTNRLHLLDARRIAAVSETAVKSAFSNGPSVMVGRGSQFFLRNRKDVFHVFLYASRDHKIRRLISMGETQNKAIELVDTTDKARAAFVRQYLGLKWQEPHLYHAMFNFHPTANTVQGPSPLCDLDRSEAKSRDLRSVFTQPPIRFKAPLPFVISVEAKWRDLRSAIT
jgi:hypothetical protein